MSVSSQNEAKGLVAEVRPARVFFPKTGFEPGGYVICSCTVERVLEGDIFTPERITIKGNVFSLNPGILYRLRATLQQDERYGDYYKVLAFEEISQLNNRSDQDAYLQAVLTNRQYELLQEHLDDPYATLMQQDKKALCAIPGIGESTADSILCRFRARIEQAKAYSILGRYGLSVNAITSLLGKVSSADELIYMVEHDPYIMMDSVDGIGWVRADAIAQKLGIQGGHPKRVQAYVRYYLNELANQGHTICYPQDLWENLSMDLGIYDQSVLRTALHEMHEKGVVYFPEDRSFLALTRLRNLEVNIAKELHRLATATPLRPKKDATQEIKELEEEQGWTYTEEQRDAIRLAMDNNVCLIIGGAGTGKSSSVRAALAAFKDYAFAQCALSGRAAARLTEVTGEQGSTIHRLLGYKAGGFMFNKDNPLPYRIIVLDEISMVGADIFYRLVQAIPDGGKLIMLGDDGQLESIGLCNLLKDMLDSHCIPVGRLTKIHRQAARSAIITESCKVRHSTPLADPDWIGQEVRGELKDLVLHVYGDAVLTEDTILEHYRQLLNEGVDFKNIQVIVPMKFRGMACTQKLNQDIQQIVNAGNADTEVRIGREENDTSYTLRLGDRVICTKNTYDAQHPGKDEETPGEQCPVYNGDRGIIKSISPARMVVTFDLWGDIVFPRGSYRNIELGYALSCHKLQGSEADYIIVGFDMSSAILLTKEWLYTAITRAKKRCILACERTALRYSVSHSNVPYKRTMLQGLLKEVFIH